MSIAAIAIKIATSAATSAVFRAFGARLAFSALRKLAAQTDNKLDDEAVSIVEQAYYGDDRKQKRAVAATASVYDNVKAE